MKPCAAPYLDALKRCKVNIANKGGPAGYSSVFEGEVITQDRLNPQYWVDNMTRTVLFDKAVNAAVEEAGPFDLVLEIGPHPSLRGPASEILGEGRPQVPYCGMLFRGKNDIDEFASALGFTWMHLGAGSVDFETFEKNFSGARHSPTLVTGLPNYPFDHPQSHMKLTRLSGGHINVRSPPNPILGRRCYDRETTDEVQWRNFLRLDVCSYLTVW